MLDVQFNGSSVKNIAGPSVIVLADSVVINIPAVVSGTTIGFVIGVLVLFNDTVLYNGLPKLVSMSDKLLVR